MSLVNADPDDIDDVLLKVEASFDIKFESDELAHIRTFGELCDHIISKTRFEKKEDCTTQQAFYKLRNALSIALSVSPGEITPGTVLDDLIPHKSRRRKIAKINAVLGFDSQVLEVHIVTALITGSAAILSIVLLFSHFATGFFLLLLSILALHIARSTARQFRPATVGEWAEMITREHYFKSRRYSTSGNKTEMRKVLHELFIRDLKLNPNKLSGDSPLSKF